MIGFGFFFIFYPASTWTLFSAIFGSFCLVDSAFNIIKFFAITFCMPDLQENKCALAWTFLLGAGCSATVGSIAIVYPAATAEAMLLFLAIWLIVLGACQTWFAFLLADCCAGIVGILYLVTGTTFLVDLQDNVGFFVLWVGICFVVFGIQVVVFAIHLKLMYGGARGSYQQVGETTAFDV